MYLFEDNIVHWAKLKVFVVDIDNDCDDIVAIGLVRNIDEEIEKEWSIQK